jgi:hypothetical protein
LEVIAEFQHKTHERDNRTRPMGINNHNILGCVVNTNNTGKQVLSEETRRKIAEMRLKLDQKASARNTNKFIKFKDGDHRLLQFIPDKTREELVTYESQPDKPVNRYKFYVHDLSSESAGDVLEWTASETVAADILKWIEKGYCAMHITRKGSDLKTRYYIDPLLD